MSSVMKAFGIVHALSAVLPMTAASLDETDEACALQLVRDGRKETHCSATESVSCPGSGNACAGNQCCPRTAASGNLTFPCPSADNTFAGCESNTKLSNCRSASSLLEHPHCDASKSVSCPGSGNACAGNQCCPRTAASGNL